MKSSRIKIAIMFALALISMPCVVLAAINGTTDWSYEVTEEWTAIYGNVSGVPNLEAGASVGVFGPDGTCYGAGVFNGNRYFLSAFEEDAGYKTTNDYPIPGFKPGDEIIFQVYTDKAYTVKTSSGQPFMYTSHGMYPPLNVDLVYREETPEPDPDPDPGPNPIAPVDPAPEDTAPPGSSLAPMGSWALADEGENVESTGPPPPMDESVDSERDEIVRDVLTSGPERNRYAASSPSSSYGSSVSRMPVKGSGKEGGQIFGYEKHDDDNDAYKRIEDIISAPFKNRAGRVKSENGSKMPRKNGMPMPLKLLLLFVLPGLIVTGTAVKLWVF